MFRPFPSPQPSPVSTSVFTRRSLYTACGDEQFVCCYCLRPYHKGYLLGAVAVWSLGFMKSNAANVLNGGASMVNVQVVVLC